MLISALCTWHICFCGLLLACSVQINKEPAELSRKWGVVLPFGRKLYTRQLHLHPIPPAVSLLLAPHSTLSGVACSKWTQTHTHSNRRGGECHPPLAQSFFIGVKVSDSFRVLQTNDYIWSQLNETSWEPVWTSLISSLKQVAQGFQDANPCCKGSKKRSLYSKLLALDEDGCSGAFRIKWSITNSRAGIPAHGKQL